MGNKISQYRTEIMGMAMLSIMLFHQPWISVFPMNAFHVWGHYGVDVFFFVSGFGLAYSIQKHSLFDFYKRRLFRIMPLCVVCGMCKYSIFCFGDSYLYKMNDISCLTIFGLDLWFIQTILSFYLLFPLILHLVKEQFVYFLVTILLICLATSVFIPNVLNNFTGSINRLPVFVLGMSYAIKRWNISCNQLIISALMAILAMASTLLTIKDYFHFGNDLWMYPILAFGMPAFISIMVFIISRLPPIFNVALAFVGHHSLELYLWHEFVYTCVWLTLNQHYNYFLLMATAIILSFVLAITSAACTDYLLSSINRKSRYYSSDK